MKIQAVPEVLKSKRKLLVSSTNKCSIEGVHDEKAAFSPWAPEPSCYVTGTRVLVLMRSGLPAAALWAGHVKKSGLLELIVGRRTV